MRILFIAETVPYPPDNGGRIKSYYTLKGLSRHHEVHLVCFSREETQFAFAGPLREVCHKVHMIHLPRTKSREAGYLAAGILGPRGYVMQRHVDSGARARVREIFDAHSFDAVYADHLSMAAYALDLDTFRILDEHNVEYRIIQRFAETGGLSARSLLGKMEWKKMRDYETSVLKKMDLVLACTPEDGRMLTTMAGPRTPLRVVPIGFDTAGIEPRKTPPDTRMILSVGTLYWPPNSDAVCWFHSEILPKVLESQSGAEFVIVGSRPPEQIVAMASDQVRVTGYVSDDELANLYRQAAVCVVPLRSGSGMRVKILEALSRGTPVVSTTVGCEGIEVTNGENILIADEPEAFAEAVGRVLGDRHLAERLSVNGRRLAEERYDWRTIWKKLDTVFEEVASGTLAAGTPGGGEGSG